jgi:hypothetical protein
LQGIMKEKNGTSSCTACTSERASSRRQEYIKQTGTGMWRGKKKKV